MPWCYPQIIIVQKWIIKSVLKIDCSDSYTTQKIYVKPLNCIRKMDKFYVNYSLIKLFLKSKNRKKNEPSSTGCSLKDNDNLVPANAEGKCLSKSWTILSYHACLWKWCQYSSIIYGKPNQVKMFLFRLSDRMHYILLQQSVLPWNL